MLPMFCKEYDPINNKCKICMDNGKMMIINNNNNNNKDNNNNHNNNNNNNITKCIDRFC